MARHHARRNGLAGRIRTVHAAGYRRRDLRRWDYDLILANILARPLALMARDLKRAIAPGGTAVLALDMYEHAYQMDYGANAGGYVDAVMKAVSWRNANETFARLGA